MQYKQILRLSMDKKEFLLIGLLNTLHFLRVVSTVKYINYTTLKDISLEIVLIVFRLITHLFIIFDLFSILRPDI